MCLLRPQIPTIQITIFFCWQATLSTQLHFKTQRTMTQSPVLLLFLLCKQLLYRNGTGHAEQYCEKFMSKSDRTTWNRFFLEKFLIYSWYPSCLVPLTFSWSLLHINHGHFSNVWWAPYICLCKIEWTTSTSNIHWFSWTCKTCAISIT